MPPKVRFFLALVFGTSWLMAAIFFLAGGNWHGLPGMALGTAYMFMPAFSALTVRKFSARGPLRDELAVSFRVNRWWAFAWLLPPALAVAALGVSLLFPGVSFAPGMEGMFERLAGQLTAEQIAEMKRQAAALPFHPFWFALLQGLVAGISVNALVALGEEIGWRGFLYRELAHHGFWKSSLMTGFFWGAWHAPLILQGHNYPGRPVAGVFLMIAWCILLSPVFTLVRLKSRSVVAAAVMHGSLNATFGLSLMTVRGAGELVIGLTGLAGMIVLVFLNAGIFLFFRRD